ncbi:nucleoporin Nup188 [Venturia canescens]|uniref:nucleoporin Nup188 n=1 Tax=Venturia canescens TaxID=32260 RepID=UPI001C9D326E|nr:nucleoporin Nup188 [Venturia canescens]
MQQVEAIGDLPSCKGLWSVICGTTSRCDKALVVDEIKNATQLLKEGINFFKSYTEASLQKVYKTNPPARMYDLIGKLAPVLNLDATIAWDLVCNFMLYEYRNCAETFATQLADLTSMRNLIEDIWSFYYFERITLIKCLKLMSEYRDEKHPHSKEFNKFFTQLSSDNLLKSVRKQIESLKFINPPSRVSSFSENHLRRLYNNSLVEMRELFHVLTILLEDKLPNASEFEAIYGSTCGEPRRLVSAMSHEDKKLVAKKLEEIRHCKMALLVVSLDVTKHEDMPELILQLRSSMQDTLEHKCLRDSTSQNGPFLLAWMLANYAIEPDNAEILNQFRPFGIKAIQLDVFNQLQSLMDAEMIREDTKYARVVRKSVYNLLTLLCSFVDDVRISSFSGIFEAVGSTLRYPEIADLFWNDMAQETGLWPYYDRAVALFPHKFEPLTLIATGLASASKSSAEKIADALDRLETVTLEVPRNRGHSMNNSGNVGSIRQPYRPYERECTMHRNNFMIEGDCKRISVEVTSSDTEIVRWQKRSRYGDAFHHKIEQLLSQAGGGLTNVSEFDTSLPEHVYQGFCLLVELLGADLDITPGMVIPTEMSLEIINRFSYPVLPLKIYNVVASCCRVTSKLVLKYPEEILSRMRVGVYPRFNDTFQNTKDLASAVSFDGGLIASWLSGIESIEHRYTILSTYLDTLWNYLVMRYSKETMYNVEIPGMVFLLQAVLPKLDSWYFASEGERIDLWFKSMSCLHRALDSNLPKGEPRKELQLVVAYSLLYLEPRHALLKLVRTGERNLQCKMMEETDWLSGKGFRVIRSVQYALSLVNRLLMFRHSLGLGHDERSPLEIDLYASPCVPNGLLIVPTIVNYLYLSFSPALQAMAVRLLKKFAQGFSMSLLVCMGMDGTAIRETFASRLMSPTCSAEVKVAILDLVAVCLERQPGLTEALFNIMHQAERRRIFPRPADEFLTEGCSRFIELYLNRIDEEDKIVEDSLYDSTMNLLHAMWYNRNEILVNYFRKRERFWSQFFAPLMRPLVPRARGYAYLIDIITLEIFETSPPSMQENDFAVNLEKLLLKGDHWQRITKYILVNPGDSVNEERSKEEIETPLYEANIEAWYNFIVTLTDPRISNDLVHRIDPTKIRDMTRLTLDSLSARIKKTVVEIVDARITMLLASLALRCVTTWRNDCVQSSSQFVEQIVQLMQDMIHSYGAYGFALRRTLLALILGCIQLVKSTIASDNASLEYLLAQACNLSSIELHKLENIARSRKNDTIYDDDQAMEVTTDNQNLDKPEESFSKSRKSQQNDIECIPGTLAISMVTQLLRCNVDSNVRNSSRFGRRSSCFQLRQLIPQLMSYLGGTVQTYRCLTFSKAALEFLGTVARSPYYNPSPSPIDDEESIAKLWLALIPPNCLRNSILDSLYDDSTNQGTWRCRDWWSVYTLGLEMVTGLVNGVDDPNGDLMPTCPAHVNSILLFLGSHENYLLESATLLRHTADPLAMDLVQSLVALISTVSVRSNLWGSLQPSVCDSLMKCMYLVYDSTVNLLLRPRILKFIIDGVSVESAEELQSCDDKVLSVELKLLVNKLIVVNWWCAQCFVRFSPRLNALVDTIYAQDFWYTPLAEMNFGPPQMSMNSAPRLTYGTIISSTQLFTQALYSRSTANNTPAIIGGGTGRRSNSSTDNMDSAKREWERAAPDNSRRIHTKDLRRILQIGRPSTSSCEFSSYVTGHDVTVPLLGNPRLLRRPYDPLICENTILSRTTQFGHHGSRHVSKPSGQTQTIGTSNSGLNVSSMGSRNERPETNPWFASMNENNARLALEVNLVLVLCQTLEGVKSPRLALRDRQLIARETANEIVVFFDFLEQRGDGFEEETALEGALVGSGFQANFDDNVRMVKVKRQSLAEFNARLTPGSTITKIPVGLLNHNTNDSTPAGVSLETRLDEDVITTGAFANSANNNIHFLPLLGKLLKSMLESLDSAQYS